MTRPTFTVLIDARYAPADVRPQAAPCTWKKATGHLLLEAHRPDGLHLQVSYRVACLNAGNAIHFALALLEKDMGKAGLVSPHARPASLRVAAEVAVVALPDEQVAA